MYALLRVLCAHLLASCYPTPKTCVFAHLWTPFCGVEAPCGTLWRRLEAVAYPRVVNQCIIAAHQHVYARTGKLTPNAVTRALSAASPPCCHANSLANASAPACEHWFPRSTRCWQLGHARSANASASTASSVSPLCSTFKCWRYRHCCAQPRCYVARSRQG